MYKIITTDVDVEVSLDEWSDDELLEELRQRGVDAPANDGVPDSLIELLRAMGAKCPVEVRDWVYEVRGVIL